MGKKSDLKWFFGDDIKMKSNKYFTFTRVIDDNNIIIVTNNVKLIKGVYVLVVDNDKAVYLKDWQIRKVHNYFENINAYAVKLNREYFKVYQFKTEFEDFFFECEETFDVLLEMAREQEKENLKFAKGEMDI